MKLTIKSVLLPALAIAMTVPFNSYATNGYFLIGFGSKSRAMGGVGVAQSMDGLAAAFNPATMIDSSNSIDIGAEFFRPKMAIRHNSGLLGQTDEESNHDKFLIPALGGVYKWNDKITIGAAMIGAGMKTEFAQNENNHACTLIAASGGAGCPPTLFNRLDNFAASEAGIELYQIQMLPSIAYKLNDTHTVGATLVMAGQFFRSEGLEDFGVLGFTTGGTVSTLAEAQNGLTGRGFSHSFGLGARIGWLGKFFNDKLSVGVNYSPTVDMGHFQRYQGLFAESGDFDIPENYTVGIAYKANKNITVLFDVQQINFSDVASVGNPGPSVTDPSDLNPLCPGVDTATCKLGGDLGMGFGWTDVTAYKLGVEWQYSSKIALRAGLNYGEAPIPKDQVLFNMLAPATVESHITFGGEYEFDNDMSLAVNYMHAFQNTISGPTPFGPGGAIVNGSNAAISMYQDTVGATLSIGF